MTDVVLETEHKWMWLDEDGVQCSPMHETLGAAVRHKGNWKPWPIDEDDTRDRYRKNYGSKKPPRKLVVVEVTYRIKETEATKNITEAFATSDKEEEDD